MSESPNADSMRRYRVTYLATASCGLEVEATDEQDAVDKADALFDQPYLCHMCASDMDISDWEPDESKFGVYAIDAPSNASLGAPDE